MFRSDAGVYDEYTGFPLKAIPRIYTPAAHTRYTDCFVLRIFKNRDWKFVSTPE